MSYCSFLVQVHYCCQIETYYKVLMCLVYSDMVNNLNPTVFSNILSVFIKDMDFWRIIYSPMFYEHRFVSVLAAFHPTVSASYESSHLN